MPEETSHDPHPEPSHAGTSSEQPPKNTSRHFAEGVSIGLLAHFVAPAALALASTIWLYLEKDPSVPWPTLLVFIAVTITGAYLSLISVQFFFPDDVKLSRRPKIHFILFAIVLVIVTAPLAMLQSFTSERTHDLEEELASARQTQTIVDNKRIQIYAQVTESLLQILRKSSIDSTDLHDLLHFCLESLSLSKPQVHDLRATVVYLGNDNRQLLVVPTHGYFGYALDQEITGLYFKVSGKTVDESDESYRERVGVAGWSYISKKPILDDDVLEIKPGEEHRYKRFSASERAEADRSMICIGIPDLSAPAGDRYIGVLSISSPTPGVFNKNDLAVARFFATLLGRFKTPVAIPPSVLKAERGSS